MDRLVVRGLVVKGNKHYGLTAQGSDEVRRRDLKSAADQLKGDSNESA